ncbi:MAG TPA: hypothetical protein PK812_11670 [Beijerinckiaceae bacterium]|nr:hypothetical protein [Beijerinckiaceae bacterium]
MATKSQSPKAEKPQAFSDAAISVVCTQPGGRRRAGYQFGTEPVVIAVADLDGAAIEALASDPYLSIRGVKPAEAKAE